jgi:uncharacterized membrane protein YbhN (UPF0104 family)
MGKLAMGQGVRRLLRWAAAAAVLVACAFYLGRHVDPGALGRSLSRADYRLVLLMATGHLLLLLPLKAWRWERMLAPIRRLPLATLYRYCLAGCAASNLLPARAGHAVRVLLVRRHGVPVAGAVGGLLLEEICNTAVLGLVCLPLPFMLDLPGRVRATLALVTLGAVLGVAVAVWLAVTGRGRPSGIMRRFSQGVAVLGDGRAAGAVFALTATMWLLDLGQIALAMAAVAMPPSFAGAALVLLFVNLTNALPATPGQVGLFEAGAAAACIAVGAAPEQGVAVGVLYHMMQFIPETVLGLWVLGRGALGSARLAEARAEIATTAEPTGEPWP